MILPRYAVYYIPPADHPLTRAAAQWIGRSPFAVEPRSYGFHATLKAPFRLKENFGVEDLEEAIRRIARTSTPCRIGPLKIGMLKDFFALLPVGTIPGVHSTAARIVQELDGFRAPLFESELQRRLRIPLDAVERAYLGDWGYPYVLDRFRFHMTLTDPVEPDNRPSVLAELEEIFAPFLEEDYYLDTLSLFVQAFPQADFRVRSQFPCGERI